MDPREAEENLALADRRRQQAVTEGTSRWSAKDTWSICSLALALGVLIDADMLWLWFVILVTGAGVAVSRGVRLRGHPASPGWTAALAGTFLVAAGAYVAGQALARAYELPIPATAGMVLASLVIVLLCRPVQARWAASRRR